MQESMAAAISAMYAKLRLLNARIIDTAQKMIVENSMNKENISSKCV